MQREFSFSPAHLEAAHSCHQDSLHWGPHTSLSQSGHLDFHNHCPRKGELTISRFITYLWLHSSVWHKYPHRKTINYIMRTHPWKHITLSKQTGTPACPLSSKKGTGHLRVTAVLSGNYFMWQMTITCFIQTYSMILINFFFIFRKNWLFLPPQKQYLLFWNYCSIWEVLQNDTIHLPIHGYHRQYFSYVLWQYFSYVEYEKLRYLRMSINNAGVTNKIFQ